LWSSTHSLLGGALLLLPEPLFPGGSAWPSRFSTNDGAGGALNQLNESFKYVLPVPVLRSKTPSGQNQNSFNGHPATGYGNQPFPRVVRQRGGVTNVEAQLDGGGHLVYILSAGSRGSNELQFQLGLADLNLVGNLDHLFSLTEPQS
jgi:hypothetical protein